MDKVRAIVSEMITVGMDDGRRLERERIVKLLRAYGSLNITPDAIIKVADAIELIEGKK